MVTRLSNGNYKWTAFMRLKGETSARREQDVLDEFDAFIQSLQRVSVEYKIIVMVEGQVRRILRSESPVREMRSETSTE